MTARASLPLQHLQTATLLLRQGRYLQARDLLEQTLRIEPRLVEGYTLLAATLRALGDAAGVERALRLAMMLEPQRIPPRLALGDLLAEIGRHDEAEALLRETLVASGHHPQTVVALARLLLARGRADAALALCEVHVDLHPTAELLNEYGRALQDMQRVEDALAAF
ncbi:MAG TPA: tetratricopeptide repeat protein, partial [Mizugakiibacter sp.]